MVSAVSQPAPKQTPLNSLSVGIFALIDCTAKVGQPASRGAFFHPFCMPPSKSSFSGSVMKARHISYHYAG
ncbi:hypothetical protein EHS86_12160 [Erwinia amylovora]|nr:hypothetical protein AD997_12955 [Erwinia amylovora]RWS37802.1 hypothetical protein EHS86_12160 [Erwinia amylovora]